MFFPLDFFLVGFGLGWGFFLRKRKHVMNWKRVCSRNTVRKLQFNITGVSNDAKVRQWLFVQVYES